MKKLHRMGTVHPTPPAVSDQLLSFLPAAILTLTTALSQEEREVLAYLISCSSANFSNSHHKKTPASGGSKGGPTDHPVCFSCYCFRCYMSYWVKWDSSPNRQLIHEIIDAFEESLFKRSRNEKSKRERRKGKSVKGKISPELDDEYNKSEPSWTKEDFSFTESNSPPEHGIEGGGEKSGREEDAEENEEEEEELERGSVRRFVSFLGERIWSVWG